MSNNKIDELAAQQAKGMMKKIELEKNINELIDKHLSQQTQIQKLIEQNRRSYAELLQQMRINDKFRDYLDFYKKFESTLSIKDQIEKVYYDAKQTMANMTKNTVSVVGLGLGLGATQIARVLVDNVLPGITKAGYQIFSSMNEKDTHMDEKYELLEQTIKHTKTQAKVIESFSNLMIKNLKNTEKTQKEKLQKFVLKHIKEKLNDPAYLENTEAAKREALKKLLSDIQITSTDEQFDLIQEFLKKYQMDDYVEIKTLTENYDTEKKEFGMIQGPLSKILESITTMLDVVPNLKEFSQEHEIRCKKYLLEEMEKIQETIMKNIDIEIEKEKVPDNKTRLEDLKNKAVKTGLYDAVNNLLDKEAKRQFVLKKRRKSIGTGDDTSSNRTIKRNKVEKKFNRRVEKTKKTFQDDKRARRIMNMLRQEFTNPKDEIEADLDFVRQSSM